MSVNLVMMGPPGAGKGTQAERFASELGIPKISTGEILREAVAAETDMGRAVKAVMEAGSLVGDDLIIGIVRERLARPDAQHGFVLDGFPRTVPQARALDALLEGSSPLVIVEIQVPDEELVRRVRLRRICQRCGTAAGAFGDGASAAVCRNCNGPLVQRPDDTEEVVRERLKVYWRETRPMVEFYRERRTYRVVNGAQTPERVREDLIASVGSALGRNTAESKA